MSLAWCKATGKKSSSYFFISQAVTFASFPQPSIQVRNSRLIPTCYQSVKPGFSKLLLLVRKDTYYTMLSSLLTLLKGKALVTAVAAAMVVGGVTAVFAATPSGQAMFQNMSGHATATVAANHKATPTKAEGTPGQKRQDNGCPGMADAQRLATEFHLSTASTGSAVQSICALRQNTFKGSTPSGVAVTSSRVYGFGEIEQLLTVAQFMATHDAGAKLTDANVSSFLAAALHTCASSHSTMDCVKDTTSGSNHGNGNGDGNGNGKPTTTPTPPPHPTPHH